MNFVEKIFNIGIRVEYTKEQNFTTRFLNQVAFFAIILMVLYMTAHILLKNGLLAVCFDFVPLITSLLILFFNYKGRFLASYITVGIGYTLSFTFISILIGSQNQIEYLLLLSGIGTTILLRDDTNYKRLFFLFALLTFIGLKIYHVYFPQGLLDKEFSPYFRIANGSFVFIFIYTIVARTMKNSDILMKKLQLKNEEISNLNTTLETKVQSRTKALAQSNKELKRFAYISAHDLREPLRNILGFSQLLKKSIANKDTKETETNLNYINWGVKRIDAITRDIVSYNELEENINNISAIDLNLIMEEIIKRKGNNQTKFWVDTLPVININSKIVQILFESLINNAIQYCDKPIREIRINYKQEAGFHYFKVSDNGIGIESQYHEKIFEMFTRLHNDFDRNGSGTGLAFCKKIVNSYGGQIWLESEYTKGSDFYFTLPV